MPDISSSTNEIHRRSIHDPAKLEIGKEYAIVNCDWQGNPEYKFIRTLTGFSDNNRSAVFGSVNVHLVVSQNGVYDRLPVQTIILEVDEPLIATLKQIGGRRKHRRGTKRARRNRRRPSRKN